MMVSVVGVCAVKSFRSRGFVLLGYTMLCIATIVGLVFLAVVWLNLAKGNTAQFGLEDRLHRAWQNTVVLDRRSACDIQQDFGCAGFRQGDCKNCLEGSSNKTVCEQNPLDCPMCEPFPDRHNLGCFDAIVSKLQKVHKPAGITCGAVAGVLLVDMVFVYLL